MTDATIAAPAAAPLGIDKLEAVMASANALTLKIIALVKKGITLEGAASLAGDASVDAAIVEIYSDINAAISQAKDLSLEEGIALAVNAAGFVPGIVAALKA